MLRTEGETEDKDKYKHKIGQWTFPAVRHTAILKVSTNSNTSDSSCLMQLPATSCFSPMHSSGRKVTNRCYVIAQNGMYIIRGYNESMGVQNKLVGGLLHKRAMWSVKVSGHLQNWHWKMWKMWFVLFCACVCPIFPTILIVLLVFVPNFFSICKRNIITFQQQIQNTD